MQSCAIWRGVCVEAAAAVRDRLIQQGHIEIDDFRAKILFVRPPRLQAQEGGTCDRHESRVCFGLE